MTKYSEQDDLGRVELHKVDGDENILRTRLLVVDCDGRGQEVPGRGSDSSMSTSALSTSAMGLIEYMAQMSKA
jgi:hypothetical protein